MKSISIHNLDSELERLIRKKARNSHMSLNKTIQMLLGESLHLTASEKTDYQEEFRDLFGIWSKEDIKEFDEAIKVFEFIEKEDWA